ncbi:MAG: dTMP kinase [Thermoplasmatales archaeon]|nr:dTMP kinase [Thermoplasmatales archaeon]MCW6170737.1 dTMP kinase [Thermoplasmatales archaeon]
MMFIALEGIDGSGKSTITRLVAERLKKDGFKVFTTHEPTNDKVAIDDLVRDRNVESYLKLFFSFTEDRFSHQLKIKEHLDNGEIVLCDRYLLSSYAYQGQVIQGLFGNKHEAIQWMTNVSRIITVRPDMNFLLDIDPDIALKRISERKQVTSFEDLGYLKSVRDFYTSLVSSDTILIDASKSTKDVTEDVYKILQSRITQ